MGEACESGFQSGDLVITEVMANPLGDDADREYFEIYNATGAAANLAGLSIVTSRADGTGESSHRMRSIEVAANGYLVLGNTDKDLLHPYLDYGYESDLGALRNSESKISLFCSGVLVDEIRYGTTINGQSVELNGDLTLDHTANDVAANLCNASPNGNEYEMDNFGTPGEQNGSCDNVVVSNCDAIAEGDLVITEIMANPAGSDGGNEYIEIYNTTGTSIDLEGLVVKAMKNDDTSVKTHAIAAAAIGSTEYFAMGDSDMAQPHLAYTYGTASQLSSIRNTDGVLELLCGDVVVDRVEYATAASGQSLQLKPEITPTSSVNDKAANLCNTEATAANEFVMDAGNFGTPGETNTTCDSGTVVTDCSGINAGDLAITEVLANPASTDAGNEFVEFYNTTDASIDLEGLVIKGMKNDGSAVKMQALGAAIIDGSTYFAAGDADMALTHLDYIYGTSSSLSSIRNSDGVIELICDAVVVDRIEYASATSGRSLQLDAGITPSAAANDDPLNLCNTPAVVANEYVMDAGNYGTPSDANVACE